MRFLEKSTLPVAVLFFLSVGAVALLHEQVHLAPAHIIGLVLILTMLSSFIVDVAIWKMKQGEG